MSNRFADDLLGKYDERFSVDSLNMSYTDWVCKNTTIKKRPFTLKNYEFQRAILDDMHSNLSCIKISQVGLTEIQIRKALAFLVRNQGTSAIFSLPNEDMYKRISNGRVKPIVDNDKVFNTPYDKANRVTRSMDMKQFGQSFLYLVPAIESAATSISADMVLSDEKDLSDQQMIALFNSRLQGSSYRISQQFSTPTFPSYGIDLDWRGSDQNRYMIKCGCCGNWTYPEFNRKFVHLPGAPDDMELWDIPEEIKDDLIFNDAYIMCDRCHEPLDLNDPALREWVASYPSRTQSRGYAINPFITASLDLSYIYTSLWKFVKNENKRGFFNTVLGQPYSDGSIQIPEDKIRDAMTTSSGPPNLAGYEDLLIGIDVGAICHIVIGDIQGNPISFYQIDSSKLVKHVEELCSKYNIRAGSIDRFPYTPTADEVFKVSGGKIIPTEYRGQKETNIVLDPYDDVSHAQVNRTMMLDKVSTRIKKASMRISGYGMYKEVIVTHLRNMVREETPEKEATWVKLLPDDHFFHALGFMSISLDIFDMVKIKLKSEVRTMVLASVVNPKSKTPNMIGVSTERLEPHGFKR